MELSVYAGSDDTKVFVAATEISLDDECAVEIPTIGKLFIRVRVSPDDCLNSSFWSDVIKLLKDGWTIERKTERVIRFGWYDNSEIDNKMIEEVKEKIEKHSYKFKGISHDHGHLWLEFEEVSE